MPKDLLFVLFKYQRIVCGMNYAMVKRRRE